MGVNIVDLATERKLGGSSQTRSVLDDVLFSTHHVANPAMSIWTMKAPAEKTLLPWWDSESTIDEQTKMLSKHWLVNTAQEFYDFLFLAHLQKIHGKNLYWIVSGGLNKDTLELPKGVKIVWDEAVPCGYRLEASYEKSLKIHWNNAEGPCRVFSGVTIQYAWPLFVRARQFGIENCVTLFSLSDPSKLEAVLKILREPTGNRSVDLVSLVDWFGCYASPKSNTENACMAVYAKEKETVASFQTFQDEFKNFLSTTRSQIEAAPSSQTVFKLLSRFVAL